jgi:fimbrial chaperone protein
MLYRGISIAFAVALSLGPAAHAAAVVLWPINPTIAADQRATALWVENRGSDPVTLQVRAFGWSQSNGEDHYAQQDEVVASPPIATVAPGKRQLVRVIRRDGAPQDAERSYRLLIDELPPPLEAARPGQTIAHLAVQMRYSIPLFTYRNPANPAPPALNARIIAEGDKRFVQISNAGQVHARLVDLRMAQGSRPVSILSGLVGYVLPGVTMRWQLPAGISSSGAVIVNVNGRDETLAPSA